MTEDATPEQLLSVGVLGLCCCLVAAAGLVAVVIWLMRSKDHPATVSQFHLSVIALAFDGAFRPQVDALLTAAQSTADPVGVRVELVRRTAQALLGVAPQWRLFGYGEKDLTELTAAQQSYASAVDDFRTRSALPPDGGSLTVLTLVLCTRGRRLGVERLDTRQQIHSLLHDRLQLDTGVLLGAEVVWAPSSGGLSESTVRERFPEMHLIAQ